MYQNKYVLLIISLLLNGFGNALAISTMLGSVIWTASGQSLALLFDLDVGTALTLYGIVILIVSCVINRKFDLKKILGNFLFMVIFSYLVDLLSRDLIAMGIDDLSMVKRLVLNFLAVIFISVAVSFYQKANIVLHPNDELMLVIRSKYTNNNAAKAQWIAYIIPIFTIIISYFGMGKVDGIGIGTLVSLCVQGYLIDLTDYIFFRDRNVLKDKVGN